MGNERSKSKDSFLFAVNNFWLLVVVLILLVALVFLSYYLGMVHMDKNSVSEERSTIVKMDRLATEHVLSLDLRNVAWRTTGGYQSCFEECDWSTGKKDSCSWYCEYYGEGSFINEVGNKDLIYQFYCDVRTEVCGLHSRYFEGSNQIRVNMVK